MNTPTETLTNDTLAASFLYTAAHTMLRRERHVQLGNLLHGFRGIASSYEFPTAWIEPFRHLSEAEVQGIYERVLYCLERDFGPLRCVDPTDTTFPEWGYAGPVGIPTDTNLQLHEQWLKREAAFDAGHPDGFRNWEEKTVPQTIWFTPEVIVELAA